MIKKIWFISVLVTGLLFVCGCQSKNPESVVVTDKTDADWRLIPDSSLLGDNFKIVWQSKLPFDSVDRLGKLEIIGGRIYGFSYVNYLVSLNRETGNVVFIQKVAPAAMPVLGFAEYGDTLYSVLGNRLVEIIPDSGVEKKDSMRLGFGATCAVVRNRSYFYVAGSDRRLHAMRAKDKIQVFEAASDTDSIITAIVCDEETAVFATQKGEVISIAADGSRKRWQFKADGAVTGDIVERDKELLFASADTNVYVINAVTGRLIWKYQTDGILERGPRVTSGIVYQYVRSSGLIALDRKSGKLIWKLAEGLDILAESKDKAYVITNSGAIVIMDNKNVKQLYTVNIGGISKYAVNLADSKIYVADTEGRIACLTPVE